MSIEIEVPASGGRPVGALAQSDSDSDAFAGSIPPLVPPAALSGLSTPDVRITLVYTALEWGMIATAIWLCERLWSPLLFAMTIVWIGARQHGLGAMMHDGAHYWLARSKAWNDRISDALLAWPIFITTRSYRENHFAHHRHVNTDRDPDLQRKQTEDWMFPKTWLGMILLLARDAAGINTYEQFSMFSNLSRSKSEPRREDEPRSRSYLAFQLSYYGAVVATLTYYQAWTLFLLYWVVPLLTWLKLVLRLRSIAEHFALPHSQLVNPSRTTYLSWPERWLIAPHNINYHVDHHLYPSVPFYRLPKLHRLLLASPSFRERAHVTRGYCGVLRECVRPRSE